MRVFSRHSDLQSIALGTASPTPGDTPAVPVTLEFLQRNGSLVPMNVFGMLDTGASMTIIPGYRLGLSTPLGSVADSLAVAQKADTSTLAGRMDFQPVSLSGVLGSGRIPGYLAFVSIGGHRLEKVILVGAVVGQWEPLIGRDVTSEFIIALDPWQRTAALARKKYGRLLSLILSRIRGRLLVP